jgi:hypothetical protein
MTPHVLTRTPRPTRRALAGIGAALALAAAGAGTAIAAARAPAAPIAARSTRTPSEPIAAHASRALSVNDTGNLHLLNASGAILSEAGPVSGTLPGSTKVRLNVGENVTATFTIYARGGGSITGHGVAALHSSGRYSSFGGTLTVRRGTGRYAHAHGAGKLYGVIDRRTDALTVQTSGTLHY